MTSTFASPAATPALPGLMAYLRQTAQEIRAAASRHRVIHAIAAFSYVAGILECLWLGLPVNYDLVSIVSGSGLVFLGVAIGLWLAFDLLRLWRQGYEGSPSKALVAKLATDILAPTRVANALNIFVANGIFFVGFIAIKKAIPHLVPFAWDERLAALDAALHFGRHPHEWLMPLFRSPFMLMLMNVTYNLWFGVLLFCFFWFGYAKSDSAMRQRYFIAYLLLWLLGTCVAGTILSSAGPCFYGHVVAGPDPYAGLLSTLRSANDIWPIWAVPTQDTLWQSNLAGHGDIEGVSAMPSLHVATSVLFILQARAWGKRWAVWFTSLFAIVIFMGSIVLAWHYAADGYVGGVLALACWWIAGKLAPPVEPAAI
ncbi:MAG: phosphatase PAP2 family protein [Hyphomicrobiales bacterium]